MPKKKRTLGSTLRHYRDASGLTQLELANETGLDRSYIGHIELGNRFPTVETLKKLASALGIHWTMLAVG